MPDNAAITPGAGVAVAADEVATPLTGTVSKNATVTVTGTGTAFLAQTKAGDVIRIPGGAGTEDRVVAAVASDTSLTVSLAFTTTASGQTAQSIVHYQRAKMVFGADGAAADVHQDSLLPVNIGAILSTANSLSGASGNLAANATWTGTGEDVRSYAVIEVNVWSPQLSGARGIEVQFSDDNATWQTDQFFFVEPGERRTLLYPVKGRYLRLLYTNGPSSTTGTTVTTFLRGTSHGDDPDLLGTWERGLGPYGRYMREVWDDFGRADTASPNQWALRKTPSGHVWLVTGANFTDMRITSGVANLGGVGASGKTAYMYLFLSQPVARIGGIIILGAGSTASDNVLVIGNLQPAGVSFIASWVHCQFTNTGYSIDVIDINGAFATLQAGSWGTAMVAARAYRAEVTIEGDTLVMEGPDNTFVRVQDARIQQFAGNMALWEMLTAGATALEPKWDAVWVDVLKEPGKITTDRSQIVKVSGYLALQATFRFALRSVSLTFTAGQVKELVAFWHAATVTRRITVRYVGYTVQSVSAASIISVELVKITTAPTGGTTITPPPANPAQPAATTSVMQAPTTSGTEASVVAAGHTWNAGISSGTTDPTKVQPIPLYNYQGGNDAEPLQARPYTLEGYAIRVHSTAIATVIITPEIEFTEGN